MTLEEKKKWKTHFSLISHFIKLFSEVRFIMADVQLSGDSIVNFFLVDVFGFEWLSTFLTCSSFLILLIVDSFVFSLWEKLI